MLTVFNQEGEGQKAGSDGKYGSRGGGGAIGDPSLNSSLECVELGLHFQEGVEEVPAL